jgi:hypothetical protein
VLAPGANITAAGQTLRGTSQAAPHVAGAFAVLKGVRPYAAVDYLAKAVTTTGPNVTDNRFAAGPITAHRLDLAAALAAVKLDATAPALTAPRVNFTPGATLGTDAAMSVDTTWSATDANGIGSYVIQIGVNGVFTDKTSALSPATSTALTFTGMKPGTTYEVRVAAGDRAGNWTGWVSTGPFKVYALDQTNTTITRSTGWSTAAYAPGYGGSISVTSTNGAWTRYSVPARSIAWVGTSATNRGKATVTVGTTTTTVDASAASTLNRRVEFVAKNLDVTKSTTLTIANQATSGRPSIDVDAILVIQ